VRSSKAKRLTRIKKGYYTPPRGPIFVPGLHAIGLLLASRHKAAGVVQLALMRWWTSRGVWASFGRDEQVKLLRGMQHRWGKRVLHVFDQGFAGSPWLGALYGFGVRFTVRWNKKFELVSAEGVKQPPWHFSRGKKGLAPRQLHDAVKRRTVEGTILWYPVTHPDFPGWKLTLIVSRRKNGAPWYLLTNEPVETEEQAWRIAMAYIRRWQIEMAFGHLKSEMAIQSLRVYDWEPRLKLLGLVALAYAFLMELMREGAHQARDWLLDVACHRSDSRQKEAAIPLTRLRIALSKLWQMYPCLFVRRGAVFR
jgi:transposase